MVENQRIKATFDYLRDNKHVRNQQDFTERINSDKSTVSQILNGRVRVPNGMFANIASAFPFISEEWLRTGSGEMVKRTYTQQIYGGEKITQTGDINECGSDVVMRALNEISEMRKLLDRAIATNEECLKTSQRTNERLLNLLESMHSNV